MKKNDRVKMGNKVGTVVGSTYREVSTGNRYIEVMFDGEQYLSNALVEELELI